MKLVFGLYCVLLLYCKTVYALPYSDIVGYRSCVNMWDEGCINGQLPGSGNDDDYLNGGFNPGKRCVNAWDPSCTNGPMDNNVHSDNYHVAEGKETKAGRRFLYELLEKLRRAHQLY